MIINTNYQIEPGEHGMAVIIVTGRCTGEAAQVAAIEGNCCRRFSLNPIPNTTSVVFKSLDGSIPVITSITPLTIAKTYTCVKIEGRVNPLAASQTAGPRSGSTILRYMMRYQEVVSVA
jgi:hypothetical protein